MFAILLYLLQSLSCPIGSTVATREAPVDGICHICISADGHANGPWIEYSSEGVKRRSGFFSKGKPDGLWITYRIDGLIVSELEYHNGFRNGKFIERSPKSGHIVKTGFYVDDMPTGEWSIFDGEGRPLGAYKLLRGTGTVPEWDHDGHLWRALVLVNNVPVEELKYARSGKVVRRRLDKPTAAFGPGDAGNQ